MIVLKDASWGYPRKENTSLDCYRWVGIKHNDEDLFEATGIVKACCQSINKKKVVVSSMLAFYLPKTEIVVNIGSKYFVSLKALRTFVHEFLCERNAGVFPFGWNDEMWKLLHSLFKGSEIKYTPIQDYYETPVTTFTDVYDVTVSGVDTSKSNWALQIDNPIDDPADDSDDSNKQTGKFIIGGINKKAVKSLEFLTDEDEVKAGSDTVVAGPSDSAKQIKSFKFECGDIKDVVKHLSNKDAIDYLLEELKKLTLNIKVTLE